MRIHSLFIITFLSFSSIYAQSPSDSSAPTPENQVVSFLQGLNPKQLSDVHFQLVTVTPAHTVTTAFGHSALRVYSGKQFDKTDFYIDFGEYDESPGFVWRFLKGEALFFVKIRTMANAYTFWDTTGRGIYTSEFILDDTQKMKFANAILKVMSDKKNGYEYDNFESNCVTFIRDIIGDVYGKALALETDANKSTWRARLLPYSQTIFWLRFCEKLLLDHDTDIQRDSNKIIYLPYDLLFAVEDAKITKEKEMVHPDFLKMPESFDLLGNFVFALFVGIVLSQIPGYLRKRFSNLGTKVFGFISIVAGAFTLLVLLLTSFPFMNDTIMILVFTPIDYILWKKDKFSDATFKKYLYLRLGMLSLAFLLRISILPQSIDAALFFTCVYFGLIFYNLRKDSSSNLQATSSN
ncbi:MAG: DUF4105 domain-containing protein [Leptospira sp.]|nr:DUF4105 domain-containing protein [Leptospira sp.]